MPPTATMSFGRELIRSSKRPWRANVKNDHNGHFRLYRVDDHLRPWRLDDGTDSGWKASVRWVDVEPDMAITLGRDGHMVWLEGHAAVRVSEFDCCCPDGCADIARPHDSDAACDTAEWN